MKDKHPQAAHRSGSLARKILGKNPRTSAIMITIIVTLCLIFGFSKEAIQRYEDALRKGLGIGAEEGCPAGWVSYQHEVIGIGFCYPESWGNVRTEPKEPVTRLADLLEDYADGENEYRDSFLILFDNNEDITLQVFNENYNGERYAGDPAATGFTDNIGVLRETGAICDYEKDYSYKGNYEARIKETYAECGSGIKTAITDTQETSNERIDTSVLESLAYARLANGYFDHVLVDYVYGDTIKLGTEYGSIASMLPVLGMSEEQFGEKQDDFTAFAGSIEAFAPEERARAEFEPAEGEDERITAIRRYYYLIASGKLEEAYAMKSDGENYEDFSRSYEDALSARPYDFEDKGGNVFSFLLKYQDHNEREREYEVKMEASGGKLKTISVRDAAAGSVSYGEYSASVTEKEGRKYVILRKGEEETIVDEGSDYGAEAKAAGFGESFSGLAFSPDGRYLMYSSHDYEYLGSSVYDIEGKKSLMEIPGTKVGEGFGFTPDGRYFFFCASAGMIGGDPGKVYSVPGFEQVFDAAADGSDSYLANSCTYDAERKAIIFTASDTMDVSIPQRREAIIFTASGMDAMMPRDKEAVFETEK